jgi:predicted alpha/beta-fold hydrolase
MSMAQTVTPHRVQVLNIEDSSSYYSQASSFQYIPKVKVPCLFPVALDDPFVKYVAAFS